MKKALITGIAAAIIATAAGAGAVIGTTGAAASNGASLTPCVQTAVLRQGSKGGEVKEVQRRLKEWGYYNGAIDGVYGRAQLRRLKSFNAKTGLLPTVLPANLPMPRWG